MNLLTPGGAENCRPLYVLVLSYLLSTESQIVNRLPGMIEHADDLRLKYAFQSSLQETRVHLGRLDEIIDEVNDAELFGEKDDTAAALLDSCDNIIKELVEGPERDAGLIAKAQEIKRYEIASYGAAIDWAKLLGLYRHVELLQQALDEKLGAENLSTICLRANGSSAAA
jgi:ferritin-like metal-binding protein YciE